MTRSDLRIGGTMVRRLLAFAIAGTAVLFGGCVQDLMVTGRFQLKPDDVIIERRPDTAYEKLFPYYVELCAASQFRSKLTGEGGGPAGHAILYIKGACKDDDAPFPQLRRCHRVVTNLKDPEHGAGISVNQMFKNINWVAVPGYDLVFQGGLASGERLTRARFEAVEQQAIATGIYKGVTFHPFPGATSDADLRDFLQRAGIGTDLALQFARSVFCARLPVTEAMLSPIINFSLVSSTLPLSAVDDYGEISAPHRMSRPRFVVGFCALLTISQVTVPPNTTSVKTHMTLLSGWPHKFLNISAQPMMKRLRGDL